MNLNNLVLRPNCLLTKAPLVFVTGPRSIFFYDKLAARLQDFIAAHGYVVVSIALPFRNKELRKRAFNNWLSRNQHKDFHFILGPETKKEFSTELSQLLHSTVTIIGENFKVEKSAFGVPLKYRLHELFCKITGHKAEAFANTLSTENPLVYDRFLDHCVQLAEDEVITNA